MRSGPRAANGRTTWCGFARRIFALSKDLGGPCVPVDAIATTDYPTPAKRPANSRLDCSRFAEAFGHRLPHWEQGLAACLPRLI